MELKFCQSCGMPLSPEVLGTNADGSKSEEYCIYCYKDGAFTGDFNMEQMVEFCSQFVDEFNAPTAAKALSPANCPTTATSAKLNICWKMLLKAIGMANLRIFRPRGPFSISIFVFDAAMQYLENGRKFSFFYCGNKKGLCHGTLLTG